MILPKSAFIVLGIPGHYHGVTYKDTKLVPTRQKAIEESIGRAPSSGVLLVSGTAAPIVNQFITIGKKTIGISFPELFDDRFNSGDNDSHPNASVVLLYDIGLEAAKSKEFSATILNSIISYYKSRETLLILETQLSVSNFTTTYGLSIKNTLSIPIKEEEAWV